jgi:hypothetical protein
MASIQGLITEFHEAVGAINTRRNLEFRLKVNATCREATWPLVDPTIILIGDRATEEILARATEICDVLASELENEKSHLSPEQAMTLRDVVTSSLLLATGQAKNEIFSSPSVTNVIHGENKANFTSYLAEQTTTAEGAAFAATRRRLKLVLRKHGVSDKALSAATATSASDAPDQTVYVDANCFLQLRDLKDLPWRTPFPKVKWIEIAVAKAIVEELDRFKNSDKRRLRDRSRAALTTIDLASSATDGYVVLRETNPRITLRYVGQLAVDHDLEAKLDLRYPDDRLVAAFVTGSRVSPSKLLSYDTGPRITARPLAGIAEVMEPPVDWRLADTPDAKDDEIKTLKAEVKTLKASKPEIQIDAATVVSCPTPLLEPLPVEIAEKLVVGVLQVNPRLELKAGPTNTTYGMLGQNTALTLKDIQSYESSYTAFEGRVRTYFDELHAKVRHFALVQSIPYDLRNISSIAVTALTIAISINTEGTLFADADAADLWRNDIALPQPPEAPLPEAQRKRLDMAAQIQPLLPKRDAPRKPNTLYWLERPTFGDVAGSLTCPEFRARETLPDEILATSFAQDQNEYQLTLKVSASNLPAPVTAHITVTREECQMEWTDQRLKALLPGGLWERIQGVLTN